MLNDRNWTVLFVGGISGAGKSSFAYELGRHYGVKVLEMDDLHAAIKSVTTIETFPLIHYWSSGVDWKDIGVNENVDWLIGVSKEMIPAINVVVERHLEDSLPVIIEGDFIHPETAVSFNNPAIKALFVHEPHKEQLLKNYNDREGGALQHYRADVSIAYGKWQAEICQRLGIDVIEARPWDTAVNRAIACLLANSADQH